jgi:hypothetical protein
MGRGGGYGELDEAFDLGVGDAESREVFGWFFGEPRKELEGR